jgi:hypothetical protein
MMRIREENFKRIVAGICEDKHLIIKHNPIGTDEEILLWMLLNSLVSYLSLSDSDSPKLKGKTDAEGYREAIRFVLQDRRENDFHFEHYLDNICDAG